MKGPEERWLPMKANMANRGKTRKHRDTETQRFLSLEVTEIREIRVESLGFRV